MAAITSDQAKAIMNSPRVKARAMLRDCLGMEPFDEEEQLNSSIFVDYLYNAAKQAADKGFSWPQVAVAVNFSHDVLKYSLKKNITEAIKFVSSKSDYLTKVLGERNYKVFVDFLFSTFMSHYRLFQFVFTKGREVQRPVVELTVEAPVPPPSMAGGIQAKIWEYEKKIQGIEMLTKEKQTQREQMFKQLEKDNKANKMKMELEIESLGYPLTKDDLKGLLHDILGAYARATEEELMFTIDATNEDLELKLQASALPRPTILGPPPRFQPKPKMPQSPLSGRKRDSLKSEVARKKSSSVGAQSRCSSRTNKS